MPVDKKALGREIAVAPGDENGAADGDLVSATLGARRAASACPQAGCASGWARLDSEKAVSLIAHPRPRHPARLLARRRWPRPSAAEPATSRGREDWRDLPLVTIDPPDAKDHDDAVHAAPDDDPDNPGGFVLTVAIADVAAYVRPGSALDREALERGNSVYFPDRVVPMLPERISNDLCSLRQDEDRPALAVRMVIDADGRKRGHSVPPRADALGREARPTRRRRRPIDGRPDETTRPAPRARPAAALGRLRGARAGRATRAAPLDLDLPERKIILNGRRHGRPRRRSRERLDAHRLIEEFMILANVAAAETLEAQGSPLLYRVHDEPSLEKMRALRRGAGLGRHQAAEGGALKPAPLQRHPAARSPGSEHEPFINEVVLRSQAQADYAAENFGHFGLNLRRYAHFTSPIRRYADLIVHRALIRALRLGADGLPDGDDARAAARDRRADLGRRAARHGGRARHRRPADRLPPRRPGRRDLRGPHLRASTRSGLFVKLDETGADGFVPAATLGADYYRYDEAATRWSASAPARRSGSATGSR